MPSRLDVKQDSRKLPANRVLNEGLRHNFRHTTWLIVTPMPLSC